MAARSVPCLDCGQPVPADRVSCPSCGAPTGAGAGAVLPGPAPVTADADTSRSSDISKPAHGTPADDGPAGDTPADDEPVASAIVSADVAPVGLVPGAYLPPSTVFRPEPATPPAHQMPLAASPSVGALPPATASRWTPPPPAAEESQPRSVGRASLFADLPFDAPDSLAEWLVAIGSAAAAISFLLPWISGTVSYDTSWGLASASRLPILAVLVVTAILGILPNGVALWVRAGVLGLIGGSLFLGLVWPIVAGDFGDAAFGAVLGAAAAIVLVIGGIVAVAPRRGAPTPP